MDRVLKGLIGAACLAVTAASVSFAWHQYTEANAAEVETKAALASVIARSACGTSLAALERDARDEAALKGVANCLAIGALSKQDIQQSLDRVRRGDVTY